jgi:cytochrome c
VQYHFKYQEIKMIRQAQTALLFAALAFSYNASAAVDVEAAKSLARENNCFKCHGVDKEKDGPSYKKVADKYRGKADAEAKLIHHITSGEKAKFADGHEEDHKNIQGKATPDAIKNLADWILSL